MGIHKKLHRQKVKARNARLKQGEKTLIKAIQTKMQESVPKPPAEAPQFRSED